MGQRGEFFKKTAVGTAFSVVLLTLTAVPVIGPAALFLSVAPQVIMARGKNISGAFASWAIVLAAAYLLGGLGFLGAYGILFFFYGLWYVKVLSFTSDPVGRIINASAGWLILAGLLALGSNYLFKVNLIESVFIDFRLEAGAFASRYIDLGMPEMEYALENIIAFFFKAFSGIIAMAALGGSWLVYLVLSGYGSEKPLIPLERFRLPDEFIWALLGSAAIFLIGGKFFSGGFLQMLGANAGMIILAFYFVSGAALAFFLMGRWRINRFTRGALIVALVFFLNGIYILTALGIVDVWVNFREKLIKSKN